MTGIRPLKIDGGEVKQLQPGDVIDPTFLPVGGFLVYYFQNTASDVATYYKQISTPYIPSTALTAVPVTTTGDVVYNFITDPNYPNRTYLPQGLIQLNVHAYKSAGTKDVAIYAEIYETNASGVDIALITTTGTTPVLTGVDSDNYISITLPNNYIYASSSSRIRSCLKAVVSGTGSAPSVVISVGGTTDSRLMLPSNIVDATNFVPYTGAPNDLDMGTKNITTTGNITGNVENSTGIYWKTVKGTPTRTGNTTFTITDTANANLYDLLYSRGTVLKWTDTTTKMAMVVSATYSANTVTVTIIGDTLAVSATMTSFKASILKATKITFSIPGTIAVANDTAGRFYCEYALKIFGADGYHNTAGTTNATTYNISKNSSSGASTILSSALSIASASTVTTGQSASDGTTAVLSDYLTLNVVSLSTTAPITATIYLYIFPLQNQYLN